MNYVINIFSIKIELKISMFEYYLLIISGVILSFKLNGLSVRNCYEAKAVQFAYDIRPHVKCNFACANESEHCNDEKF